MTTGLRHILGMNRTAITSLAVVAGLLTAAGCAATAENDASLSSEVCGDVGQWFDPTTGQVLDSKAILSGLVGKDIVLLGEKHATRDHQLWQAQTISGIRALNPDVIVGFEMFPRSVQPALDAWTSGALTEKAFLTQSRWSEVWGFGSDYYMPMLDQARVNRTPLVALNVDRSLIGKVGQGGWDSVDEEDREGVGDPAPASDAYNRSLAKVFLLKQQHGGHGQSGNNDGETEELTVEDILEMKRFQTFVEAQLTWDRAMAEGLATAKRENPDAVVVGVMGRGHVQYGHGVPHQLADLGFENVASLIPVASGERCEEIESGFADAVFVVDPAPKKVEPYKPRLGVMIEPAEAGVLIVRIVKESIAEAAELAAGDVVTTAAGVPVRTNQELAEIIQRQPPGSWLPLEVLRGDETVSIIAKFPPVFWSEE